ncbi:MAG: hypothetical protein PHQ90_11560 [Sulfuricurvum sp.]|uniref:hypothetical protein n=1 Tax=Sulfuricurvum sp. TaxID=2025608 RepID=UPI002602D654|nr:hypothetical protein [Sulfuricurvum sp.]MDD2369932.1 hypothetical protein [Sulfuricurvum sp.]MDD5118931.1 hypothetical protein [Sulfuricurvum sp.]
MKKLTFKNILFISLVAYIVISVAGSFNYFSMVDNESLPSFDRLNYGPFIVIGFFWILIFFLPFQIFLKYIKSNFNTYVTLTVLMLVSLIFLDAYFFLDGKYMYTTFSRSEMLIDIFFNTFLSILISSIVFFFFLKWSLKPKGDNNG